MSKPSVLIVGAGALGITTGYHLCLAGVTTNFLVRPNRLQTLQSPQVLYCYDDSQLKQYSDYQAVDSVAAAAKQKFHFVLVTLDGATCLGTEATTLLQALGDAIRDTAAIVLVCGIGVREHCRQVMQLPEDRIVEGTMAMLSYQVDRVTLPVNPPTDPDQLAQASIAYGHVGKNTGFMIADKPAKPAQDFAALYNGCGISRCNVVNNTMYTMLTSSIFPLLAVFDLAGWPDARTLAGNKELMSLGTKAIKETMRLPQHGWQGKLGSLMINRFLLARYNAKMERDCLPVDYSAFNKFHHGGKVRDQDIQVMRQCAESGKAQGKSMPALNEILRRYEAHCAS